MKYLFSHWEEVADTLLGSNALLFLDYDGTLAPIAPHPHLALLPDKTKQIMLKICDNPRCRVAVISGRMLEDVQKLVGIDGIIYAGNHGLEIQAPHFKYVSELVPEYCEMLGTIKKNIEEYIRAFDGVFVEDKHATLSIHYRLASPQTGLQIRQMIKHIMGVYIGTGLVKVYSGKKVIEIRPGRACNKGMAVKTIMAKCGWEQHGIHNKVIYIGDDVTDEDAFRELAGWGITIHVGEGRRSAAYYYVKTTEEAAEAIDRINNELR